MDFSSDQRMHGKSSFRPIPATPLCPSHRRLRHLHHKFPHQHTTWLHPRLSPERPPLCPRMCSSLPVSPCRPGLPRPLPPWVPRQRLAAAQYLRLSHGPPRRQRGLMLGPTHRRVAAINLQRRRLRRMAPVPCRRPRLPHSRHQNYLRTNGIPRRSAQSRAATVLAKASLTPLTSWNSDLMKRCCTLVAVARTAHSVSSSAL